MELSMEILPSQQLKRHPTIGVKLIPRDPLEPDFLGHMGLTWKLATGRTFRGFRFKVEELPPAYRSPSRFRAYLHDHRVPGHVFNDFMLRDALAKTPQKVLCKQWTVEAGEVLQIDMNTPLGPYGTYSFEPDPSAGCHNCVTWTIEAINRVLNGVLPLVPKGRMKLAVEMLLKLGATPSA